MFYDSSTALDRLASWFQIKEVEQSKQFVFFRRTRVCSFPIFAFPPLRFKHESLLGSPTRLRRDPSRSWRKVDSRELQLKCHALLTALSFTREENEKWKVDWKSNTGGLEAESVWRRSVYSCVFEYVRQSERAGNRARKRRAKESGEYSLLKRTSKIPPSFFYLHFLSQDFPFRLHTCMLS